MEMQERSGLSYTDIVQGQEENSSAMLLSHSKDIMCSCTTGRILAGRSEILQVREAQPVAKPVCKFVLIVSLECLAFSKSACT